MNYPKSNRLRGWRNFGWRFGGRSGGRGLSVAGCASADRAIHPSDLLGRLFPLALAEEENHADEASVQHGDDHEVASKRGLLGHRAVQAGAGLTALAGW